MHAQIVLQISILGHIIACLPNSSNAKSSLSHCPHQVTATHSKQKNTPEKTHLYDTCLLHSIVLHMSGDLQHVRAVSSGLCKVLVTVINRWVGHTTMWSTTAHGVWYYIYWGLDHERR